MTAPFCSVWEVAMMLFEPGANGTYWVSGNKVYNVAACGVHGALPPIGFR
jgi:hypothetical protein